jgi:hypothetical protein
MGMVSALAEGSQERGVRDPSRGGKATKTTRRKDLASLRDTKSKCPSRKTLWMITMGYRRDGSTNLLNMERATRTRKI